MGVTLRYPYGVRNSKDCFEDIPNEAVPKDMLELATHIVHTKAGHFKPEHFEDRYESALRELIKRKQQGKPIEAPRQREPAKVIDLMEALRRSAGKTGTARRRGRRAAAPHRRTAKKASRPTARHRKAS